MPRRLAPRRGRKASRRGSYECFIAIVGSGVRLGSILMCTVQYAARVRAIPTAIAGGIAELALTFCHCADASLVDLLFHLTAMVIVASGAALSSRRAFASVDPLRRIRGLGS